MKPPLIEKLPFSLLKKITSYEIYRVLREEQDELFLKWEQSQDKLGITRKELGRMIGEYEWL